MRAGVDKFHCCNRTSAWGGAGMCSARDTISWSYTQGMLLGAAADMHALTSEAPATDFVCLLILFACCLTHFLQVALPRRSAAPDRACLLACQLYSPRRIYIILDYTTLHLVVLSAQDRFLQIGTRVLDAVIASMRRAGGGSILY